MEIHPIAFFRSPLTTKFGLPRQSGVVPTLRGRIVFEKDYRNEEALRGLEDYDYIWLIWAFSENVDAVKRPTVRPPRLGGNKRVGVFATRSSFRPNNLAISSVKIEKIEHRKDEGTVIYVLGADLLDGTPIYDIKPYLASSDSHPSAKGGFTSINNWNVLKVDNVDILKRKFNDEDISTIVSLLEQDPRPHYHDDGQRIYGMMYENTDIRFTVENNTVKITDIVE